MSDGRHDAEGHRHREKHRHKTWGETLSRRRIGFVLAGVMLGMLLSALDQTVVGTAMPRIIADLQGLQHYAWVATGYMLTSFVSMPIWGKLSDAYGRKRFYIAGMTIFVLGSVLCGQSQNMTELILFRAVQGLGAGAMMPISQAIIGDIFPPAQRAKWAGVLMSVFGVATIIGPLVGGWITDNYSWRWVFYVNVPFGIAAIAFCAVALPGHVVRHKHRIDYEGALLLVFAAVPLLLGLSWGGTEYPWRSWEIVGMFAFSAVAWVAFFFWETRAKEPVINPNLFRNRVFTISSAASTLQSAAMFGAIMFLPLFVQGVMGESATNSGIILMPMMLGAIASSIGAGQILARTGRYKALVIGGFVAASVGCYLLSRMHVDVSQARLAFNMVILGLGLGVAMSAFTVIVQNQYPSHRLGEVSAGLQFFRGIGSTVGIAIFGTLLNNRFASQMTENLSPQLAKMMGGKKIDSPQVLLSEQAQAKMQAAFARAADALGGSADQLYKAFMDAVRLSLEQSITSLFLLGTVISLLGFVVVLFLPEVPLRKTHAMDDAVAGASGVDALGPSDVPHVVEEGEDGPA
jgi:EmrB/QacA subfamily drug resistance transporter